MGRYAAHGRRSEFTDHDARRIIRQFRRRAQRRAGRQGQGQRADHGVSRPGHIIDFPRARGNMHSGFFLFKQAHALFAARDQHRMNVQPLQNLLAQAFNVLFRPHALNMGACHRFLKIGRHTGDLAVVGEIFDFRVHGNRDAALPRQGNQGADHRRVDHAFPVVRQNNRIDFRDQRLDLRPQLTADLGGQLGPKLAVKSDNLLVVRDNARL